MLRENSLERTHYSPGYGIIFCPRRCSCSRSCWGWLSRHQITMQNDIRIFSNESTWNRYVYHLVVICLYYLYKRGCGLPGDGCRGTFAWGGVGKALMPHTYIQESWVYWPGRLKAVSSRCVSGWNPPSSKLERVGSRSHPLLRFPSQ